MATTEKGLVALESRHSGAGTVQRIEAALRSKGLTIFAIIDHSGEAEKIGLKMPFTKVILFGSPMAGTPLMIASPTLAIDLPLKALVLENESGHASVYFNDPEYLRERHAVPGELLPRIAGAGMLLQKAIE